MRSEGVGGGREWCVPVCRHAYCVCPCVHLYMCTCIHMKCVYLSAMQQLYGVARIVLCANCIHSTGSVNAV